MTPIDLLVERLAENGILHSSDIAEANELFKQQLYNFYVQGGIDCVTQANRTVEDFYNDTFKSE